MPVRMSWLYAVLAALAVCLNFFEPFAGVGLLKAVPAALLTRVAFQRTRSRFGLHVTAGILCGGVGDFFLASLSEDWLMPGLVAFLLGHLFYIAAFASAFTVTRARALWVAAGLAVMVVVSALMVRALIETEQYALIAPGLLYGLVIAAMMVVCVLHRSPTRMVAAGALVFVVSDAHIVVNHLLLETPLLALTLTGYTTYYLAQFLIVAGAARESADFLVAP